MSSWLEASASVSEAVSQIRIRRRTLWPQADRWPETGTESSRTHMELCLAYDRRTSASMCVAPNLQPGWIPPVCCESLNSHSVPRSKHSPGTFHSPTLTIPHPPHPTPPNQPLLFLYKCSSAGRPAFVSTCELQWIKKGPRPEPLKTIFSTLVRTDCKCILPDDPVSSDLWENWPKYAIHLPTIALWHRML